MAHIHKDGASVFVEGPEKVDFLFALTEAAFTPALFYTSELDPAPVNPAGAVHLGWSERSPRRLVRAKLCLKRVLSGHSRVNSGVVHHWCERYLHQSQEV